MSTPTDLARRSARGSAVVIADGVRHAEQVIMEAQQQRLPDRRLEPMASAILLLEAFRRAHE